MLIVDEMHLVLNDSQRTGAIVSIAQICKEFIAFIGTLIKDKKSEKLLKWYKMLVKYTINIDNYLIAQNAVITKLLKSPARVKEVSIEIKKKEWKNLISSEDIELYERVTYRKFGGLKDDNAKMDEHDFYQSTNIAYKICNQKMVEKTKDLLIEKKPKKGTNHVMMIANSYNHQQELTRMLLEDNYNIKLTKDDILLVANKQPKNFIEGILYLDSPDLTNDTVSSKKINDYKVVVTYLSSTTVAGYNLSRLGNIVTSYYTGNIGDKEQVKQRVNRTGQERTIVVKDGKDEKNILEIGLYKIWTGILEWAKNNESTTFDHKNALAQVKG